MEQIRYFYRKKPLCDIEFKSIDKSNKGKVSNDIIAFDIETTSAYMNPMSGKLEMFNSLKKPEYYKDMIKVSLCYAWACTIEYNVFYGRCLESFLAFLEDLDKVTQGIQKYVYVHNLAFETQFLRNILFDMEVFARKKRRPIYIRWGNYEFRCSYMLTRLSLAKWAKSKKLAHQKLMGQLDYNVMRTPKTMLTASEMEYLFNDVLVMVDGLKEYVERFGSVWNIPITQTGIVRREYNNRMRDEIKYHLKMRELVPETLEEYRELIDIFGGGLTRANYLWAGDIIENVRSRDKTSAYPWAMISKKYPMTKFIETDNYNLFIGNSDYSYIITVELWDIKSKFWNTYLSLYKCTKSKDSVCDNGRIISAKYVQITCTNIDYEIILQSYDIGRQNILGFKYAINGYLPNILSMYILELFNYKTKYRDVPEYADLYMKSKEELNALFGMMCTRTITDDIVYIDNEWGIDWLNKEKFNDKIVKQKGRISKLNSSFAQGVWIPAYQRADLWSHVINGLDEDIIYMDTDSNKHTRHELYDSYFENYNAKIREEQDYHAKRLGVSSDMFRPAQPDGKICSLGEYDIDADYDKFITLGAKRYCYEKGGKLAITVSGVSKGAVKQLNAIDEFKDGLVFTTDNTGKLMLHYNDNLPVCVYCDIDNSSDFEQGLDEYESFYTYGICAQPTEYTLDLTHEYSELIQSVTDNQTRIFAERRKK